MSAGPHARVLAAVLGAVCIVLLSHGATHAIALVALGAAVLVARRGRPPSPAVVAGTVAVAALTIVLNALCTPGPRAFPQAPMLPVSAPGVRGGLLAAARLCEFGLLGAWLARSLHADDVLDVATTVLAPVRRVPGLRGADMMFGVAAASLPSVREEIDHAVLAVRLRGMTPGARLADRARFARAVAVPSFVGVLHRAETMARAMAVRGYDPARRRTSYVERRVTLGDVVLLAGTIAVCAGLLVADRRLA